MPPLREQRHGDEQQRNGGEAADRGFHAWSQRHIVEPFSYREAAGTLHGIFNAMSSAIISTMDAAGRLVLPKAIRDEAQLKPGMPLQITVSDGRVEIEPAPREVRIVRKGRVSVVVPVEPVEPLTLATVNETIDRLRNGER